MSPPDFGSLPTTPPQLLSHVYEHLSMHIEQQSSNSVLGLLSYIITVSSRPYFQSLGQSIGFEGLGHTIEAARSRARGAGSQGLTDVYDDEEPETAEEGDIDLEAQDVNVEDYPSFMTEEQREAVISARRSIKILSAPELEDIALEDMDKRMLEWLWTEEAVNSLALGMDYLTSSGSDASGTSTPKPEVIASTKYKPELFRLALFDLEPGTGISYPEGKAIAGSQLTNSSLPGFLSSFPRSLPLIAPTLPLLTNLVFSPVRTQAALLSRASLRLFMDPSSALHLRAHLTLLRGYLLMTSHAFRARLSTALFSDQDIELVEDSNTQALVPRREYEPGVQERASADSARSWAVGLSPKLIEKSRGQWPPYDSDLAFILRRVIMDSLEFVRFSELVNLGVDDIWNEAESRIGFVTRPLPSGRGREKGADPRSESYMILVQYDSSDRLFALKTSSKCNDWCLSAVAFNFHFQSSRLPLHDLQTPTTINVPHNGGYPFEIQKDILTSPASTSRYEDGNL